MFDGFETIVRRHAARRAINKALAMESTSKCEEFIPSDQTPSDMLKVIDEIHATWAANIEKMAAAYLQEVGIPPSQVCLVQKNTPTGFEWWFQTRQEREEDEKLRALRDALRRFRQGERNESVANYQGPHGEGIRLQRGLNGCKDLIDAIDALVGDD